MNNQVAAECLSKIVCAYKTIAEAYRTNSPAPEWAIKALKKKAK